jgi:hypothetical protein
MVVPADGGSPRCLAMSVARRGFRDGSCRGHMMGPPLHRVSSVMLLSQRPAAAYSACCLLTTVVPVVCTAL